MVKPLTWHEFKAQVDEKIALLELDPEKVFLFEVDYLHDDGDMMVSVLPLEDESEAIIIENFKYEA